MIVTLSFYPVATLMCAVSVLKDLKNAWNAVLRSTIMRPRRAIFPHLQQLRRDRTMVGPTMGATEWDLLNTTMTHTIAGLRNVYRFQRM